jgi:hypothetical protein
MPSGGCPGFCPQPRGIFPQRPSSCGLSRRPSSSSCPPCVGRANLLPTSLLIAQSPLGCQDPPYSKTLTPFPKREGGPDQARNSTERKGARPCSRAGPADPVLQVYSALLVIRVLGSERLPAKRLFCSCRQHCRRPTRRQVIPRPCARCREMPDSYEVRPSGVNPNREGFSWRSGRAGSRSRSIDSLEQGARAIAELEDRVPSGQVVVAAAGGVGRHIQSHEDGLPSVGIELVPVSIAGSDAFAYHPRRWARGNREGCGWCVAWIAQEE